MRVPRRLIVLAVGLLSAVAVTGSSATRPAKVRLLHKGHVVICVSQNAVKAHLRHGDTVLGSC